jgi:hypothetical protein
MPPVAAPTRPASGSTHFQPCGVQTCGPEPEPPQYPKIMWELKWTSTKAVSTTAVMPHTTAAPNTRTPRPIPCTYPV